MKVAIYNGVSEFTDEVRTRLDRLWNELQAAGCGVNLLATAHASSVQDLYRRPAYARLMEKNLFPTVLVMHRDKSYHWERLPA